MERAASMAGAQRKCRAEVSYPAASPPSEGIDRLAKTLIDQLIVPRLIEEYLREYGPASTRKEAPSES